MISLTFIRLQNIRLLLLFSALCLPAFVGTSLASSRAVGEAYLLSFTSHQPDTGTYGAILLHPFAQVGKRLVLRTHLPQANTQVVWLENGGRLIYFCHQQAYGTCLLDLQDEQTSFLVAKSGSDLSVGRGKIGFASYDPLVVLTALQNDNETFFMEQFDVVPFSIRDWSPTGKLVVAEPVGPVGSFSGFPNVQIGLFDLHTGKVTRLSDRATNDYSPLWLHDWTHVFLTGDKMMEDVKATESTEKMYRSDVYVMNLNGSQKTNLTNIPYLETQVKLLDVSPVDSRIVYVERYLDPRRMDQLLIMNADGTQRMQVSDYQELTDTGYENIAINPTSASFSPDGQYLALHLEAGHIQVLDLACLAEVATCPQRLRTLTDAYQGVPTWSPIPLNIEELLPRGNSEIVKEWATPPPLIYGD